MADWDILITPELKQLKIEHDKLAPIVGNGHFQARWVPRFEQEKQSTFSISGGTHI
jgi:hypothetical protein